jgi:hypothetical protein
MDPMDDERTPDGISLCRRRELIKLGVGAIGAAVTAQRSANRRATATADAGGGRAPAAADGAGRWPPPTATRAGYVHDANRASGNGPMDDTRRARS